MKGGGERDKPKVKIRWISVTVPEHTEHTGFCNGSVDLTYLSSHISEPPVECLMRASPMWRSLASSDLAEVWLQRMSASYAWIGWRMRRSRSPGFGLAPCFRFLPDIQMGSTTWKRKTFGG